MRATGWSQVKGTDRKLLRNSPGSILSLITGDYKSILCLKPFTASNSPDEANAQDGIVYSLHATVNRLGNVPDPTLTWSAMT